MRTLLLLTILTLTSCQGFIYEKELPHNYFLIACDINEQMCLSYNDNGGSNYSTVIDATVFEAQWNDRFILVKTHPESIKESIKHGLYYQYIKDRNFNYTTADSLAEIEAEKIIESGKLTKTKVTLYYLLDTKQVGQNAWLYLTETELQKAILEKKVSNFDNKEYFADLDK